MQKGFVSHISLGLSNRFFIFVLFLFVFSVSLFRGPYSSGGGIVQASSVISQLCWKVSGLLGRHVQWWDWRSKAKVNPCAERNFHPYNTQRGPVGHCTCCVRGTHTFTLTHRSTNRFIKLSVFFTLVFPCWFLIILVKSLIYIHILMKSLLISRTHLETSEKLSMN